MGRKLSTMPKDFVNTPVVNIRGKVGSTFVGRLLGSKSIPSGFKNDKGEEKKQYIYEFAALDGDMEIQIKKDKGVYIPAEVAEGGTVAVFAPSRLHNGLSQATPGQTLTITYLGIGKSTRGGGKPHLYDVEVE